MPRESTKKLTRWGRRLSIPLPLLLCACSTLRPPPACLEPPPPDPSLMVAPTFQQAILSILCQGLTSADPSCSSATKPTPK